MALQRQLFSFLMIFIISIISGSTSTIHGDPPHDYDHLEEYGYDFEAYPSSYSISNIEEHNDNEVIRVLASANVVSVNDFGAKGDGRSDDTQVHTLLYFLDRRKERQKKDSARKDSIYPQPNINSLLYVFNYYYDENLFFKHNL